MSLRFPNSLGCAVLLLIVFLPAALAVYFLKSAIWLLLVPAEIVAFALFVAAWPSKERQITPGQFADELEKHLLGTEEPYDWDDYVSTVRIADPRLDKIRIELWKFDYLAHEEDRAKLKDLIEALRSGEVPKFVPSRGLTYR